MQQLVGVILFGAVMLFSMVLSAGLIIFWDLLSVLMVVLPLLSFTLLANPFEGGISLTKALCFHRFPERESRHLATYFKGLAFIATFVGLIGTIIGFIIIGANLSDPLRLGPGISVSLITLFYGMCLSFVFLGYYQFYKMRSGND